MSGLVGLLVGWLGRRLVPVPAGLGRGGGGSRVVMARVSGGGRVGGGSGVRRRSDRVLPPLVQGRSVGGVSVVVAYPEVDPDSWPGLVELPPEFTGVNRRLASWPVVEVPVVDPSWSAPEAEVVAGVEVLEGSEGCWVVFESYVSGGGLLEVLVSEHGCAVITLGGSRDLVYGPTDLEHACVMFGRFLNESELSARLGSGLGGRVGLGVSA